VSVRVARRLSRHAVWITAALALASRSIAAEPGLLSAVTIDHLRITAGGSQEAWISVRDGEGMPLGGLERAVFSVAEDDHPVADLEVRAWDDLHHSLVLSVIVDPGLLAGQARQDLTALIRTVAQRLPGDTRLRFSSAGVGGGHVEGRLANLSELLDGIAALEPGQGARIYDALVAEVRRAGRARRDVGSAILLVTRRGDEGSGHGLADVLAIAEQHGRRIPILVIPVGERAREEASRLEMLATRTAGGAEPAAGPDAISAVAERLLPLARTGYRLRFRSREWDRATDRHTLSVRVTQEGRSRADTQEFNAREVTVRPWWQAPQTWLWTSVAALAALGLWLTSRRPRQFALVQDSGTGEGCWFEVFGTPLTLGAAAGNDIVLDEPQVSRNHAVIERHGRQVEIVDLNSGNGTFVNDEPVSRRLLADGDVIRLGERVELSYRTERS
jgi:hypothetical protein